MKFLPVAVFLCLVVQQCLCQSNCFGEGNSHPKINPAQTSKAIDVFSLKLFIDIATSYPKNSIVLSPYSVWSVLNLAYFGTGGTTEAQLKKSLGVKSKANSLIESAIISSKLKLDKGTTFNSANKAYFASDITLVQCSLDKLTEIQRLDFKNSQNAANVINKDISDATEGKIENFLSPAIIKDSRFILINAVYFKGNWTFPFPNAKTSEKPFYDETRQNAIGSAKMMSVQAKLRYFDSEKLGAAVLELPYENSNISMFLILPSLNARNSAKSETVNSVLNKLTSDALDKVTANFRVRNTLVIMPRFKMTTRIADELKTGLRNLGITDLFDPNLIDLTNFIPNEKVVVNDALHHATIEVSEEGTVAAAATGLIGTRSGGNVVNFIAERPFIFLIRDVSQKVTLFLGVLRSPDHTVAF